MPPSHSHSFICYCGLPLFFDADEGTWLCSARFDVSHSESQAKAHAEVQAKLTQVRTAAGALGGAARAAKLSPIQRNEIATKAAKARWRR